MMSPLKVVTFQFGTEEYVDLKAFSSAASELVFGLDPSTRRVRVLKKTRNEFYVFR
jgi:hypothetical protein